MVNDSLLRLFNSEFFNAWIAVTYLFKYSDKDDIQHYLCDALKKFPSVEIEFFLPQLMHLLVTQPKTSTALEDTLIDLGKKSPHFAVMSIWYLQTYMSDWSSDPTSPSYLLCERVLNKCQANLLADQLQPTDWIDTTENQGIHCDVDDDDDDDMDIATATATANQYQPSVTGSTTINEDRHSQQHWDIENTLELDTNKNEDGDNLSRPPSSASSLPPLHSRQSSQRSMDSSSDRPQPLSPTRPFSFSVSLEDLHGGKAFSLSRYLSSHIKWSQHKSFQRMHRMVSGGSSSIEDRTASPTLNVNTRIMGSSSVPLNDGHPPSPAPFSSNHHDDYLLRRQYTSSLPPPSPLQDDSSSSGQHLPTLIRSSSSTSSFFSPRTSSDSLTHANNNSNKTKRQHLQHEHQWVRSGYFQYEMQFLVALSDIAERLVALPKLARVSALHAELTLLNHNLPAEICLPLWCSGSCSSLHHRVVRVSPSDAVVLNSAERAPYLLMIEVLDDGMCLELEGIKASANEMDVPLVAYGQDIMDNHAQQHGTRELHDDDKDDDDTMDLGTITNKISASESTGHKKTFGEESLTNMMDDDADGVLGSSDFSRQMRTAAIMLAQLQQQDANDPAQPMVHAIRQRVIDQMVSLEEQRLEAIAAQQYESEQALDIHQGGNEPDNGSNKNNFGMKDEPRSMMMMNKDDPSAAVFSEAWQVKKERIRETSPFGHLPNWRLLSVIVKQGTDLRQEQFAIQLIREMQKIWQDAGVDAWVQYYRVLVTSDNSGLIETIRNTISIHSIKKNAYTKKDDSVYTLRDFFEQRWGPPTSSTFRAAQDAFMKSLVGYSIACYLLQIKDRHNGNLLIDDQGHLIHIDFGFVLSNSPGSVGFEMAPFKLSQEYIDVLGGMDSELFGKYRMLMKQAFKAVRKYGDNILLLVEMMSKSSHLPCFENGSQHVLYQLKERFQFPLTDPQLESFVDKLIVNSCGNLFTRLYDTFQYYSQGIL
ncbi:kinase-like domain-containing protein [Absidia repens]|uniref:1-phosphatidylinositol 4-kinase n=1 Tax=Absidia repens TaxID=90262 RepID=A0A1X2IQG2_9FUNG|nr:kinase-like domain-containing protein [Absidia repens]